MDINLLIWSFLIIFMLHNFEEIITLERWFNNIYPKVSKHIPLFIKKNTDKFSNINTAQFSMAVCVLFLVSSALILITIATKQYSLFIGLNIFFALNIVTHPIQSIYLRRYVPGLWTTLIIIIPYNILVFYQLYVKEILDLTTIIGSIVVMLLLIPVLIISHIIAEKNLQNILK